MKKILLVFGMVTIITNVSLAAISNNLKYGQKGDQVTELQEFLIDKGFLTGNSTGFFGALTLKAVKTYQTSLSLPATGFVGPMTRDIINKELSTLSQEAEQAEIAETGTVTPVVTVNDVCINVEGVQTTVPTGMWSNDGKTCFVPEVHTTSTPPAQSQPVTYSDPNIKVYTPVAQAKISRKSISADVQQQGAWTPENQYLVTVRAVIYNDDGKSTRDYPVTITPSNGQSQTLTSASGGMGVWNYMARFNLSYGGLTTFTVDVPGLGMSKTFEINVQ